MRPNWLGQVSLAFGKTIALLRKNPKWALITLGFGLVIYSIASSLSIFQLSISQPSDLVKALNPTVIFLISVLLKILFSFWIMALISGVFNPHQISEFGAKIFGIELSHKYTGDLLVAREGQEKLQRHITILNDLNRGILEFLSQPFEDRILASADKTKVIRQMVEGILTKTYCCICPQIKIQVIPLTENAIESLEEKISQIVMLLYLEEVDITTVEQDKIGISIHHSEDDLGSVIIIDASTADYHMALAEICAAGTLFVAISTTVYWALESRANQTGADKEVN